MRRIPPRHRRQAARPVRGHRVGESSVVPPWPARPRVATVVVTALGLALAHLPGLPAQGADPEAGEGRGVEAGEVADAFERESLALRTSLHYDPSLAAPLETLVELYRDAGRDEELVALYRTHITQYPADVGAHAVFVRILVALRREEAASMIRLSLQRHPESALLHYVDFAERRRRRAEGEIEALRRAVELESEGSRRQSWMGELVALALEEGRDDVAREALDRAAEQAGDRAESLVSVARRMLEVPFPVPALEVLARAAAATEDPELGVEIDLLSAEAEAGAGRHDEAVARLDRLLERVAPDYWRRSEIVSRRVALVDSDAGREEMLARARAAFAEAPHRESTALDLAELLEASGLRRDAVGVLLDAAVRLPDSAEIERRLLELLERTSDVHRTVAFLEERVRAAPGRDDLAYRLVKASFLSGNERRGEEVFVPLLERLDPAARASQVLELARFLRRNSLTRECARWFERFVEMAPDRLDVRRELAEVWLALGDVDGVRRLFAATDVGRVALEHFLDAVQFLVDREFLGEAIDRLEERLAAEPTRFELHLLMVEALGRAGERARGEASIEASRNLADTGPRYGRWLETAIRFHERFDTTAGFFDAEEARFVGGEDAWSPDQFARFLILCDAAQRNERDERVAAALRRRLEGAGVPPETRVELRRLLVAVLEGDPANAVEVQRELEALATEDPAQEASYRGRLAVLYHAASRPDLARQVLESLALESIADLEVLKGLPALCLEFGMLSEAAAVLERLTELEPASLGHWERRITVMAALGDEAALRRALQDLLAGASGAPLSEETYSLLARHLEASYWRSIARLLDEGSRGRGSLDLVLPMLDAVERGASPRSEARVWALWARAVVLGRLGRGEASREALDSLRAVVRREAARGEHDAGAAPPAVAVPARPTVPEGGGDGFAGDWIRFPDGLAVSLEAALALAGDEGGRAPSMDPGGSDSGRGPMAGPLSVGWVFEATGGAAIDTVVPTAGGDVVVMDRERRLYRLDGRSGKVLWERVLPRPDSGGRPQRPAVVAGSASGRPGAPARAGAASGASAAVVRGVPRIEISGEGEFERILVPLAEGLCCLDARSGDVLWRASLGEPLPITITPNVAFQVTAETVAPTEVFLEGSRVVAFSPFTGMAASFHLRTGKLLWMTDVSDPYDRRAPPSLSAGAAHVDGMLFAWGHRPVILDTGSGRPMWTMDPDLVGEFPVTLRTSEDAGSSLSGSDLDGVESGRVLAGVLSAAGGGLLSPTGVDYLGLSGVDRFRLRQFVEGRGRMVAPAVQWASAASEGEPVAATLEGRRLLLMSGTGLHVLPLDLPLSASRFAVSGACLGTAGGTAVFLAPDGSSLRFARFRRESVETVSLDRVGPFSGAASRRVILGESRVFVAGPAGLLAVNVHTGREVFFARWPAELAPDVDPGSGASGPAALGVPGAAAPASTTGAYWQGLVLQGRGSGGGIRRPWPEFAPRGGVADDDRLFLLVGADGSRLAALEAGARATGSAPGDGRETTSSP